MLTFLFKAANEPGSVEAACLAWAVVPMPVQFSKPLLCPWDCDCMPSGWSGTWAVTHLVIPYAVEGQTHTCTVCSEPKASQKNSAGHFPELLPHCPTDTFRFPGAPLLILQPESWCIIYPVLPHSQPPVQLPRSLLGYSNC